MSKPDFEAMMIECFGPCRCAGGFRERGLVAPDCALCGSGPDVLAALRSAYAAGLERAAEIVVGARCGGQSTYDLGWDQGADKIGDSIRAEKETTDE